MAVEGKLLSGYVMADSEDNACQTIAMIRSNMIENTSYEQQLKLCSVYEDVTQRELQGCPTLELDSILNKRIYGSIFQNPMKPFWIISYIVSSPGGRVVYSLFDRFDKAKN